MSKRRPSEEKAIGPDSLKLSVANQIDYGTYFRAVWLELATLAVVSFIMASVHSMPAYNFRHRIVPLSPSEGLGHSTSIGAGLQGPVNLDYPREQEPISSLVCALVAIFLPILIIAVFQLQNQNLMDLHAGVFGILKAVVSTTFVCVVLKQIVGGFRPYYIDACNPDAAMIYKESPSERYWFNATACKGSKHDIQKALQTFPSGHTANSFASAVFLSLYLNGKLKLFSKQATRFWTIIVAAAPPIGAALLSGSMYTSHHHANDITCGMVIGLFLGILAYRSAYKSAFDSRYNHLPLPIVALPVQRLYMMEANRPSLDQVVESIYMAKL